MKQNKKYWFDFPGAEILYPILALVCVFFYVGSYYIGIALDPNVVFSDLIVWYIFAILGYVFCGMWGMLKDWWNGKFVIIGAMNLLFTFLSFQTELYPYIPYCKNVLLGFAIGIVIYCLVMVIIKLKSRKVAILWFLPVLLISLYYITKRTWLIIPVGLVVMLIIAWVCTCYKTKVLRCVIPIVAAVFYLTSSLFYYPLNPLLVFQKIESIGMSIPSRVTSLIVEKDGKYIIEDGVSGYCPIDNKFECWKFIPPYSAAFVGFNAEKFKEFENNTLIDLVRTPLFPIIMTDSCVYFTSQVDAYKVIDKYKSSNDKVTKMTALIFQDFLDLYQINDSANYEKLKTHQRILQEEFVKLTTDTIEVINRKDKIDIFLKELSRNASLGMWNALCSDLTINRDINNALGAFSYQFYLTFLESPLYKIISTNFNFRFDPSTRNKYGNYISINSYDLKMEDTMYPWVKFLTTTLLLAEQYSRNVLTGVILSELKDMEPAKNPTLVSLLDIDKTLEKKKRIDKILDMLTTSSPTPMISEYASHLLKFMCICVSRDYMPEYDAYFLNRFITITPLVPLNQNSVELYNNMLNKYNDAFSKVTDNSDDPRRYVPPYIKALKDALEVKISEQDKLNELLEELGLKNS